ncbi:MAG TPA: polyprenyl synthetase family protein [Rhodanobacteraceae bacterium]|nr:polyprenyl synthetase family protein [Rhodanobacteraceae bacterium]
MTQSFAPPDMQRVNDALTRYRDPVIEGMRAALDRPEIQHMRHMRYHLGFEDAEGRAIEATGGKMLRPAVTLLACEAVGGDASSAMPAAVAIELLHNFSLIHDDIEDRSELRHGRPTLWTLVGVPQAINAGDGLFVIAQRTLLDLSLAGVPAERVLAAASMLNDACIALCEGQHDDLGFEARERVSQAEYEAMIAGKTAALLGAAAGIGAIAGVADDTTVAALALTGIRLGMAFQIQDDVLGIWGEASETGKPASDDIRSRKKSFPIVYAFDHLDDDALAELRRVYASPASDTDVPDVLALLDSVNARAASTAQAEQWAAQAIETLRPLELDPERRAEIEAIAAFFVHRRA